METRVQLGNFTIPGLKSKLYAYGLPSIHTAQSEKAGGIENLGMS